LLIRGRKDASIPFDDGRNRKPHAGVAAGAFDDRPARLEQAGALGLFDHPDRHAVLDAVAGIEGFHLGVDGCGHLAHDAMQAYERSVADGTEDIVEHVVGHGWAHRKIEAAASIACRAQIRDRERGSVAAVESAYHQRDRHFVLCSMHDMRTPEYTFRQIVGESVALYCALIDRRPKGAAQARDARGELPC
jgi:hypothetical protein